ncbi:hypothetical protein CSUI_002133 [Cystoisospora suis]|uniref:Uncharacterized protein n=1 Tax=Cystoisospora suis TaxID=483139 RepID=A0A2C6L7M9_9APIC|nr:hypothetical protein CSUI_002133 [Cystoisospora suis]
MWRPSSAPAKVSLRGTCLSSACFCCCGYKTERGGSHVLKMPSQRPFLTENDTGIYVCPPIPPTGLEASLPSERPCERPSIFCSALMSAFSLPPRLPSLSREASAEGVSELRDRIGPSNNRSPTVEEFSSESDCSIAHFFSPRPDSAGSAGVMEFREEDRQASASLVFSSLSPSLSPSSSASPRVHSMAKGDAHEDDGNRTGKKAMTSRLEKKMRTVDGHEEGEENELFKSPLQSFSVGSGEEEAGPPDLDKHRFQVPSAAPAARAGFTSPISFGSSSSSFSSPIPSASPDFLRSAPLESCPSTLPPAATQPRCEMLPVRRAATSSYTIPTFGQPASGPGDTSASGVDCFPNLVSPRTSSTPFSSPPFRGDGPSSPHPAPAFTHHRRVPPVIAPSERKNSPVTSRSFSSLPCAAPLVASVFAGAQAPPASPSPLPALTSSDPRSPWRAVAPLVHRVGFASSTLSCSSSSLDSFLAESKFKESRRKELLTGAISSVVQSREYESESPESHAGSGTSSDLFPPALSSPFSCSYLPSSLKSPHCSTSAVTSSPEVKASVRDSKVGASVGFSRKYEVDTESALRHEMADIQQRVDTPDPTNNNTEDSTRPDSHGLYSRLHCPSSVEEQAKGPRCAAATVEHSEALQLTSEGLREGVCLAVTPLWPSVDNAAKGLACVSPASSGSGSERRSDYNVDIEASSAFLSCSPNPSSRCFSKRSLVLAGAVSRPFTGHVEGSEKAVDVVTPREERASSTEEEPRKTPERGDESEDQEEKEVIGEDALSLVGTEGGRRVSDERREVCSSPRPVSLPGKEVGSPLQSPSCSSPSCSASSSLSSPLYGCSRKETPAKDSLQENVDICAATISLPLSRRTVSPQTSLRLRRLALKVSPLAPDSGAERRSEVEVLRTSRENATSLNCDVVEDEQETAVEFLLQGHGTLWSDSESVPNADATLLTGVGDSAGGSALDRSIQENERTSQPSVSQAANSEIFRSTVGQTEREVPERLGNGSDRGGESREEVDTRRKESAATQVFLGEVRNRLERYGLEKGSHIPTQGEEAKAESEVRYGQKDDPGFLAAAVSLYPSLLCPAEERPLQRIETSPPGWVPVVFRVFDTGGSLCCSCRRALLSPSETRASKGGDSAKNRVAPPRLSVYSAPAICITSSPFSPPGVSSSFSPFYTAPRRTIGSVSELKRICPDPPSRLSGIVPAARSSSRLSRGSSWSALSARRAADESTPRALPSIGGPEDENGCCAPQQAASLVTECASAPLVAVHGSESDNCSGTGGTSGEPPERCSCSALYVVGSHRLLGCWNQRSGVRLRTSPGLYPYYVSPPVLLPRHIQAIGYKFARLSRPYPCSSSVSVSPAFVKEDTPDFHSPPRTESVCHEAKAGTKVKDKDGWSILVGERHDSWFTFRSEGLAQREQQQAEQGAWQVELVSGERRLKLPHAAAVISHTFGVNDKGISRCATQTDLVEALSLCLGSSDWNVPVFLQGGRWYQVERPDPSFFTGKKGICFPSSPRGTRQTRGGTVPERSLIASLWHVLLFGFPSRWISLSPPPHAHEPETPPSSLSPESAHPSCVVASQGLLINRDFARSAGQADAVEESEASTKETWEKSEFFGFLSATAPRRSTESPEKSVSQAARDVASKNINEAGSSALWEREADQRDKQAPKFTAGSFTWCGVVALRIAELLLRGDQELYKVTTDADSKALPFVQM